MKARQGKAAALFENRVRFLQGDGAGWSHEGAGQQRLELAVLEEMMSAYEAVRVFTRSSTNNRRRLLEIKIKGRKRVIASLEYLPVDRRWSGKTLPGTTGTQTERIALGILGFLSVGGQLEFRIEHAVAKKDAPPVFRATLGTESHEVIAPWRDVLIGAVSPVLVSSLIQSGLATASSCGNNL